MHVQPSRKFQTIARRKNGLYATFSSDKKIKKISLPMSRLKASNSEYPNQAHLKITQTNQVNGR